MLKSSKRDINLIDKLCHFTFTPKEEFAHHS